MAIFSRIKSWVSNEVLTASDLNAEFNNLLTNTKPESIEDYSSDVTTMRLTADPGGVGTESQATSLAGEIERLRFVVKRLVGAQWYTDPARYLTAGNLGVQTADIAAGAVTTAKIADSNVTTAKIADSNVTTAKIADSNVTTAKINDGAVTYAKRSSLNFSQSSSCGAFSSTSASYVDVTNLSVAITTSGRPVMITLEPDGSTGTPSSAGVSATAVNTPLAYFIITKDGTSIAETSISMNAGDGFLGEVNTFVPPSALFCKIEGTTASVEHTFKVRVACFDTNTTAYLNYTKLVVREL